jgi:squalene cyclase
MQGSDGGWAAFDVDNNWKFLNAVPFADHNAMLDPACPDITGRVLEALGAHGLGGAHPAVKRGVDFLLRNQQPDGSWYGRWGVAYIYGTCFALRGLARRAETTTAKPPSCAPANGCAPFRTPTAAGARVAPATIRAASCRRKARRRKRLGP